MDETIEQSEQNHFEALRLAGPAIAGNAHARRDFLRLLGLGAGAAALAACGESVNKITGTAATAASSVTPATVAGGSVTYDFGRADDLGVLDFAYAAEQLGAAFYQQVTSNSAFGSIFSAGEQQILRDFYGHELSHRDFFTAFFNASGATGTMVHPNFASVTFSNRLSVLQTARAIENTCVFALNNAAGYLHNGTYLALAGKLVSVEARQAAALNDLLNPKAANPGDMANPIFAPNVIDFDYPDTATTPPRTPKQVLQTVVQRVQPLVVETINVQNL